MKGYNNIYKMCHHFSLGTIIFRPRMICRLSCLFQALDNLRIGLNYGDKFRQQHRKAQTFTHTHT